MSDAGDLDLADDGAGLRIGRAGAILVAIIHRPATRNAISRSLAERLADVLNDAADDGAVRAVVLGGSPTVFSSGGDFADMCVRAPTDWREHFDHMARLTRRLATFGKPTVAAVEGWAIGGGLARACCCDRILAGANARLVYGFDRIAVLPDVGLGHMLAARVRSSRARRLMLNGFDLSADEALGEKIVDRVVEPGRAVEAALGEAVIAARAAPLPVGFIKSFSGHGLERALRFEKDCASRLFVSADHAKGLAAFRDRRSPVFAGN